MFKWLSGRGSPALPRGSLKAVGELYKRLGHVRDRFGDHRLQQPRENFLDRELGRPASLRSEAVGPNTLEQAERHPVGPNHSVRRAEFGNRELEGAFGVDDRGQLDPLTLSDRSLDPEDRRVPSGIAAGISQQIPDGLRVGIDQAFGS